MQHLQTSTRGISLMLDLNFDRLICFAAIGGALMLGGFLGSL